MKRITIYIAHLLVLVLTGCDKTVLEFPENEGVDPTLVNANLSLAIDPKIEPYEQTGRSEGEVIDAYDVRWIVEVFRDEIGGELAERRVLGCEPAADGHHTIHTSLALHAARYHVVAWMDYVDNGSVDDKYYTIPSLSSISVPAAGNYIGDEDHKDTYVARQEIDLKAHRDRWNETVARGQQRRARRVFRQREFQSYRFFHETGNPEASFRSAGGKDQRPERNQRRGAEAHGLQCRFQGTAHDVQRPDGRSERIGRRDLYGR